MSPFEMVYRLIARLALPRRWWSDHGEELIGTATQARTTGARGFAHEIRALITAGVRLRTGSTATPLAPREHWVADGLRLGVLLILSVAFGIMEAYKYLAFNAPFLEMAGGWSHLLVDSLWLAAILLIGTRQRVLGLASLIGFAGIVVCDRFMFVRENYIDGDGGTQQFAVVLIACIVALIPSTRSPSTAGGSWRWVCAPLLVGGLFRAVTFHWQSCLNTATFGSPSESHCNEVLTILWVAVPPMICGLLGLVALARSARDPRPALGVAMLLASYALVASKYATGATSEAWVAKLLSAAAFGAALLLVGAAMVRARRVPPRLTAGS